MSFRKSVIFCFSLLVCDRTFEPFSIQIQVFNFFFPAGGAKKTGRERGVTVEWEVKTSQKSLFSLRVNSSCRWREGVLTFYRPEGPGQEDRGGGGRRPTSSRTAQLHHQQTVNRTPGAAPASPACGGGTTKERRHLREEEPMSISGYALDHSSVPSRWSNSWQCEAQLNKKKSTKTRTFEKRNPKVHKIVY